MDAEPPRHRLSIRRWLAAAVVLGLAAALFFSRLGKRSLWSEEVRWAEIPREMLRADDFVRPMFNGRLYYDKPLGSYWLVAAAARFTGGVNELAARLPSAISALAAAILLMRIARRLYDREVAVLAGAILATSYGFTFFARTASADAETVAGVLVALWLFLRAQGRPGRWLFLFWLAMALTSLTKGLLGFVLPALVAGVYSTWAGFADSPSTGGFIRRMIGANSWLFNRRTILAAPLAIGVYLTPFFLSGGSLLAGLEMVYRENIRRFYDPVNHRGPTYLYAYVIFELLAPWSVLLPAALIRCRPADRFALAYFWSTFLFFTLSASRRSYYLLPVLPAAAMLIAVTLTRPGRLRLLGIWLFACAVLIAPIVLIPPSLRFPPLDQYPELPMQGAFIVAWAISVAAIGGAIVRPRHIAAALVVAAFALQGYVFVFFMPAAEVYRTQRPFAAAVRERVGAELPHIALYRTSDIVYYLASPGPLLEVHELADLRRAAAANEIHWLILRQRDRDALGGNWTEVIGEAIQPWEGPEQIGTKLLLMRRSE